MRLWAGGRYMIGTWKERNCGGIIGCQWEKNVERMEKESAKTRAGLNMRTSNTCSYTPHIHTHARTHINAHPIPLERIYMASSLMMMTKVTSHNSIAKKNKTLTSPGSQNGDALGQVADD